MIYRRPTKAKNIKLMRIILILILFGFIFYSCSTPIKPQDKIAIIGKVIQRPTAAKNGAKVIVYYYLGKQYFAISRFDARYFSYGTKFLMFIDKENSDKWEISNPTIKLNSFDDVRKVDSINYYTNEDDMNKLDSME